MLDGIMEWKSVYSVAIFSCEEKYYTFVELILTKKDSGDCPLVGIWITTYIKTTV